MWNKYCKNYIPALVQWKGGSRLWKHMLKARDNVDKDIWWEPNTRTSNMWFDNWTTLGLLYQALPEDFIFEESI